MARTSRMRKSEACKPEMKRETAESQSNVCCMDPTSFLTAGTDLPDSSLCFSKRSSGRRMERSTAGVSHSTACPLREEKKQIEEEQRRRAKMDRQCQWAAMKGFRLSSMYPRNTGEGEGGRVQFTWRRKWRQRQTGPEGDKWGRMQRCALKIPTTLETSTKAASRRCGAVRRSTKRQAGNIKKKRREEHGKRQWWKRCRNYTTKIFGREEEERQE